MNSGQVVQTFGFDEGGVTPDNPLQPVAAEHRVNDRNSGMLARAEAKANGIVIGGSEVRRHPDMRLKSAQQLGLADRISEWTYDDRGRLKTTSLLASTDPTVPKPLITTSMTPSDFLERRTVIGNENAALDLTNVFAAGSALSWSATQNAAHQPVQRDFTNGNVPAGSETFTFEGGRRKSDGKWTYEYDARGRLILMSDGDRAIGYEYSPSDRLTSRVCYQVLPDKSLQLETRTLLLARDGLPARVSFVWDQTNDRLAAIYSSAVLSPAAEATDGEARLLRQYLHGDRAYDDPIIALAARSAGAAPEQFTMLSDVAATGSVNAILDASGHLVERLSYGDSYGADVRYITAPYVERVTYGHKDGAHEVKVRFSDVLEPSTANGATLEFLDSTGAVLKTAPAPTLNSVEVVWHLTGAQWSVLSEGAMTVRIATAPTRFRAWRETTVAQPFRSTYALAELNTQLATGGSTAVTLFEVTHASRPNSGSTAALFASFQSFPFEDPAHAGIIYARARWYDSPTGTLLSPDPLAFSDSANVYSYARGNPVEGRDPTGRECISVICEFTDLTAYQVAHPILNVWLGLREDNPKKIALGYAEQAVVIATGAGISKGVQLGAGALLNRYPTAMLRTFWGESAVNVASRGGNAIFDMPVYAQSIEVTAPAPTVAELAASANEEIVPVAQEYVAPPRQLPPGPPEASVGRRNKSNGTEFEERVLNSLRVDHNTQRFTGNTAKGPVNVEPDGLTPRTGVLEIKDELHLYFDEQFRGEVALADQLEMPINVVISPRTHTITRPLQRAVNLRGGAFFEYDPVADSWKKVSFDLSAPNKVKR